MNKSMQQTLALAGVAQAAYLSYQAAHHGVVAEDKFNTSMDTLFVMDPDSTEEVYGSVANVHLGLEVLKESLEGGDSLIKSPDILRYIMGMLNIESRLKSNQQLMSGVVNGLEEIARLYPEASERHGSAAIYKAAELYQNTISTLRQRIHVKGNYQFLNDDFNAARIRTLLLAGIRSAVLWRQLGGRRWLLMLMRRQLRQDTERLLAMSKGH